MAKSFTSALVGIAIDEGLITSVNDPITAYLPELKGRGFDPITIRHLLTMDSGIRFTDLDDVIAYFYPDLRKLLLTRLTIQEPPGRSFHYNSYNSELLGMILERTTHRSPSDYLQEKCGSRWAWSMDEEHYPEGRPPPPPPPPPPPHGPSGPHGKGSKPHRPKDHGPRSRS